MVAEGLDKRINSTGELPHYRRSTSWTEQYLSYNFDAWKDTSVTRQDSYDYARDISTLDVELHTNRTPPKSVRLRREKIQ